VVTLVPALVLAAFMLPLRHGFTDDGFIHVQYARNLMERGEYSFNAGEPSFGTTSPLWVMALAALGKPLGNPEALVDLSRVLSWGAAFAALHGASHSHPCSRSPPTRGLRAGPRWEWSRPRRLCSRRW
jgi:hypothetical protein